MLGRIALRAAPERGRARQRSGGGCPPRRDPCSGRGRQGEGAEGTEVWRAALGRKGGGGNASQGKTLKPSVCSAQRCALATTGAPKWALGACKVNQEQAGADLPRRLSSFRPEVLRAATRIVES